MAKLSISKAAKEWGISRKTIQDAVKSGDLHTEAGARNSKNVDTADLLRIFGEPRSGHNTGEFIGKDVSKIRSEQVNNDMTDRLISNMEGQIKRLEHDVLFLREVVEKQINQIESLQKELAQANKPKKLLPWFGKNK